SQADTVTDRLANPPRLFREVERRIARQVLDGLSQVLSVDRVQPEWSGLERDLGAVAGRELDLALLLTNADRGRAPVHVYAQTAVRGCLQVRPRHPHDIQRFTVERVFAGREPRHVLRVARHASA